MSDSKYGRLFTEADARRLVEYALVCGEGFDATLCDIGDEMTFPADEPLFLLRGKDRAAPAAVNHYALNCVAIGTPAEHFHHAADEYSAMMRWQVANPKRVKDPD